MNRKKVENGSINGMHFDLITKFPSWQVIDEHPNGRNYVYECEVKKEDFTAFKNAVKKYDGVEVE